MLRRDVTLVYKQEWLNWLKQNDSTKDFSLQRCDLKWFILFDEMNRSLPLYGLKAVSLWVSEPLNFFPRSDPVSSRRTCLTISRKRFVTLRLRPPQQLYPNLRFSLIGFCIEYLIVCSLNSYFSPIFNLFLLF